MTTVLFTLVLTAYGIPAAGMMDRYRDGSEHV